MKKRIIVGITGASGALYGKNILHHLIDLGHEVHAVLSEMGWKVMKYECGMDNCNFPPGVIVHPNDDLFAPIASGSFKTNAMVIVPCSMNTLSLIATGTGNTLLCRAAQVTLKEKRPLIVVPRETPYNTIHLENMLRLSRAGGIILPASPGFYYNPKTIEDLSDYIVGKIFDLLDIEHSLYKRWGEG